MLKWGTNMIYIILVGIIIVLIIISNIRYTKSHPVSGKDAQWIAYCFICNDYTLFASRGGFKLGGFEHCYECGSENEIKSLGGLDPQTMINSAYSTWKKYPPAPYHWHNLTEDQKNEINFPNRRKKCYTKV